MEYKVIFQSVPYNYTSAGVLVIQAESPEPSLVTDVRGAGASQRAEEEATCPREKVSEEAGGHGFSSASAQIAERLWLEWKVARALRSRLLLRSRTLGSG